MTTCTVLLLNEVFMTKKIPDCASLSEFLFPGEREIYVILQLTLESIRHVIVRVPYVIEEILK